jgi:Domain of unknown function (DUF6457)
VSTDPDAEERTLSSWSRRLTQALQILDLEVDHKLLVELAAKSEQSVARNAGPVSAFVVGYAAGLAAANGQRDGAEAARSAAGTAMRIAEDGPEGGPDREGWTGSAQ